jgi:hypothetical protein
MFGIIAAIKYKSISIKRTRVHISNTLTKYINDDYSNANYR